MKRVGGDMGEKPLQWICRFHQTLSLMGIDYYFSSTHQFFPKKWVCGVDELSGRNY
jgi:hypothetical protein